MKFLLSSAAFFADTLIIEFRHRLSVCSCTIAHTIIIIVAIAAHFDQEPPCTCLCCLISHSFTATLTTNFVGGLLFGRVRRSTLWFPFSYRFFLLWFLQPTAFTGVLEDTKIHSLYPSRMPYDSFNTDTHKHGHAQCTATVQRERVMHLGFLGLEFFFPFPIPSRAATAHAHHATI